MATGTFAFTPVWSAVADEDASWFVSAYWSEDCA
jgi:hypothetical protein